MSPQLTEPQLAIPDRNSGTLEHSGVGVQTNMPVRALLVLRVAAALVLASYLVVFGSLAYARREFPATTAAQNADATKHAKGTFEVKVNPEPPEDKAEGSTLGRMSFDKQFHGDIEGTQRKLRAAAQRHDVQRRAADVNHRGARLGDGRVG